MEKQKTKARGQMRPFSKADVAVIRSKLSLKGSSRDLALFEMAISTMLRASDLVRMTVADVTDTSGAVVRSFSTQQRKTGRTVPVHLSDAARAALSRHIAAEGLPSSAYLFQRHDRAAGRTGAAITPTTFRTLVKYFADLAGYTDHSTFSGHSTRRTKAAILYRETKDIEGVRTLLGHASLAHTAAYLGVGTDEALALAAKIEI
ncbi:tyrosine-type recombinase/integrase [Hyphomicrobium sp. MC8b]|uniref:tyrosine-type recombinase/integrase n=1 Tax=Hyphomicrobium sp. MC8b TaxID=300273 RepID=UPI003918B121